MNKISTPVCLFIRVSTNKQDYERQVRELKEYCKKENYNIIKIIATKISGKKENREDIQELLQSANKKEFKKVIVLEVSRVGRNAREIRNTIDYLHFRKIPIIFKNLGNLESLDENGKETFVTNIIISIYSELAQEEHKRIRENIISGLNNAKAKGKILGRPEGTTSIKNILKKYSKLVADLQNGLSLNKCTKVHQVSKNTVIKIKKIIKINQKINHGK